MKYTILFFTAILWSTAAWSQETTSNLTLKYDQPRQGERIDFTYHPAGTDLEGEQHIVAVAYEYEHGKIQTYEVPLRRNGGVWEGAFKSSKDALGLYLKFQNSYQEDSNHKVDRNSGKGYPILLFNKRKQLIPGATLITAAMLQEAQDHLKIKWDPELAVILFEQEFEREPSLKRPYIATYVKALLEARKGAPAFVLAALDWLAAQSNLTEVETLLLRDTYSQLGKTDKAAAYSFLLRRNWPQGQAMRDN